MLLCFVCFRMCLACQFSDSPHCLFSFCSGPWEEGSIRAIFALNQDKVLDDYLVTTGDAFEDEIEEEYNQKCAQVVSIFLYYVYQFNVDKVCPC